MVAFYTALLMYVFAVAPARTFQPVRRVGPDARVGRRQMFRRILLPGAVPEITGGFRIALAGAWGLAAIAECLAPSRAQAS